jgi:hypothetical protein
VTNPPKLRKGDLVWVTVDDRKLGAVVELASANRRSLVIRFTGIVRGYAEAMPIRWDDDRGTYVDLLTGGVLGVEVFDF